jgi:hypothetical protein
VSPLANNGKIWGLVISLFLLALGGLGYQNNRMLEHSNKRFEEVAAQTKADRLELWQKLERVTALFLDERNRVLTVMEKLTDKVSCQGEKLSKMEAYQEERFRREGKK